MKIISCVLPEEKSPDRDMFCMLSKTPIPNVEFETIVIRRCEDRLRIPNAQARSADQSDFPIVLVDGDIKTRGRLLTAAEYEDLIDGLSIQGA